MKKSSENDQLTGNFQSFFYLFFSVPPTLNLKNNLVNQLFKKFWPNKTHMLLYSLTCLKQKLKNR